MTRHDMFWPILFLALAGPAAADNDFGPVDERNPSPFDVNKGASQ